MTERAEQIYEALMKSGLSEEELTTEINLKLNEYQGFITKQAALFLIAKDYGINIYSSKYNNEIQEEIEQLIDYNDFTIPISNISEGMQNIVITGRISSIFEKRDFVRKDGSPGVVGSFEICDNSDCIKIVLWNNQVEIMENKLFQKGEIVQIIAGYTRKGRNDKLEVHLGKKGKIVFAPEDIKLPNAEERQESEVPKIIKRKVSVKPSKYTIENLYEQEGFIKFITGTIQVKSFKELTLKNGEKSFLLKLLLSDDTSTIKVNIWGLKAVECFQVLSDGDAVKMMNVMIKLNSYTNEKELNSTKSFRLEPF